MQDLLLNLDWMKKLNSLKSLDPSWNDTIKMQRILIYFQTKHRHEKVGGKKFDGKPVMN